MPEKENITERFDWLEEAIELEATPSHIRAESITDFCKRHGLPSRNYYYHTRKPDIQARILELSLNSAKRHAPDVLLKLADKAQEGDMKAIEIYLDYVLKLAKNLDLKSDGKAIVFMPPEIALKNNIEMEQRQ